MAPPWSVLFFAYEDGDFPFRDFVSRLTRGEKVDCLAIIEHLVEWGGELNETNCLTHTDCLLEFQGKSVRVFYVLEADSLVIIDGLLRGDGDELLDAIYRKAKEYAKYKE
jgi:hypothetical protein